MDVVVIDSSTPPISPSHHQPQLSQGQRTSRGYGIAHPLVNYITKDVYTVFLIVPFLIKRSQIIIPGMIAWHQF